MGVLLAAICGSIATTSAFVESGFGSARCGPLRATRTKGVELSGGTEISGCSTSRRGMEERLACALEAGAAAPKNRLRVRVVTRNTTAIVTPSWTIVRFGAVSANCGLCVGWAAPPRREDRETIWLLAAPLAAS